MEASQGACKLSRIPVKIAVACHPYSLWLSYVQRQRGLQSVGLSPGLAEPVRSHEKYLATLKTLEDLAPRRPGGLVGGVGGPHSLDLQSRHRYGLPRKAEFMLATVPWEKTLTGSQTLVVSWLHVSGPAPTQSSSRGSPGRGKGGWEGKEEV